jgi:hypothetical protein
VAGLSGEVEIATVPPELWIGLLPVEMAAVG